MNLILADALLCNGIKNPLGIDSLIPRFSWNAEGQAAYRVIVSGSKEALRRDYGDIWDSGIVRSERNRNIMWGGCALRSATRYHWKVMVWDADSNGGAWSEPAWFETGLLYAFDWTGKWIAVPYQYRPDGPAPAPYLRSSFNLEGNPESARAYVCGLGYFELYVNGQKASDGLMNPPFTKFDTTCLYCTYDITPYLRKGENAIGVILGRGMYSENRKNAWDFDKAPWSDDPKLLLQVCVRQMDGAELALATGRTWKTADSPITDNSLYVGESYDARLELQGWSEPGFDDSAWKNAVVAHAPGGKLKSMQMELIRVVEEIAPACVREVSPGVWVYDFGRNITGWLRLKVTGQAGAVVELKCTERLQENGDIDDTNINLFVESPVGIQRDTYTLKGLGEETWEPRFTYHGFQYVQMTGFPGAPGPGALTACVAHTDLPEGGGFCCSNELINKIQAAARASVLNNWHGIPTDCPHREKNGWTGDALLSSEHTLLNFQSVNAYRKWLGDIIDCQRPSGQLPGICPTGGWGYNWGSGPAWDSILVLLPWYIYLYTGDASPLEQCWDAIEKYMGYMDGMSEEGIVEFGLGDWCPPVGEPGDGKSPVALSDTWYYYVDTLTASKIAGVLGKADGQAKYLAKGESIRQAFLKHFVDHVTGDVAGSCQTSYALALTQGLTDGELRSKIFGRLINEVERCNRHIDCGILGAKYVLEALAYGGRADLAWAIAAQRDFPSWGNWIEQGATTLWESWLGQYSRNHHMFSSVSGFFYKTLAGLNPDERAPGFRHILLKPQPVQGLDWVEAWHQSSYGRIAVRWEKSFAGLKLNIKIPAGVSATLFVPCGYAFKSVDGAGPAENETVGFCSGEHEITLPER